MRTLCRNSQHTAPTTPIGTRILLTSLLVTAAISPAHGHAQTAPPPKPPADVIVFTNGDQLTGAIERGTGNTILFKSDMAGEITVPLDKVKELHSAASFAVLRKDQPIKSLAAARAITPGTIAYQDGNLTVTRPAAAPEVVPEAQISNIIDAAGFAKDVTHGGFRSGWNGAVSGGATIVRSTDYGETFTAGIGLVRAMPDVSFLPGRDKTIFNLQETYGKLTSPVIPPTTTPTPPAVTETSIFHADAERDEYVSPAFFALGQAAFDHNYSQGLSLQQIYGGGIGWTALKNVRQELDVRGSVQFEKQHYFANSGTPDQNLVGSTISEIYHRTLPHKMLLTEAGSFIPAWNNTNAYSANASVAFAIPVFKRLSLTLTTSDNFLNDPAAYYNKNSYQFVTAVSYALK